MRKLFGFIFIVVGCLIIMAVIGIPFFNQAAEQDSVVVSGDDFQTISIKSTAINVDVRESNGSQVSVELVNPKNNQHLEVNENGNHLSVETKERSRFQIFNFSKDDTELIVYLPSHLDSELDLITVSGDIQLTDSFEFSTAFMKTVSGTIESVKQLHAKELEAVTVSGNVQLSHFNGESLDFKSTSGDIEIHELDGEIVGKTVSGNVFVQFSGENQDLDIGSTSGDIIVRVGQPNMEFEMRTTSGNLVVSHDLHDHSTSNRDISGKIGKGESYVQLRTTSGDIEIR